ncbi:MAG: hypothetical protein KatS3mg053_1380 [Candidatus Roseilinea sp.]|nr:MAG: hypothetical protein KatS3mg053_1380 [Candidatus Roseilinea sp.]GIV84075.1 MAG: hypothetical protein KatS3mg052_1082 [Candidatus Roseilinea sp.]
MEKAGLTPLPQNTTFDELNDFLTEAQRTLGPDEFAVGPGS